MLNLHFELAEMNLPSRIGYLQQECLHCFELGFMKLGHKLFHWLRNYGLILAGVQVVNLDLSSPSIIEIRFFLLTIHGDLFSYLFDNRFLFMVCNP